MLMKDENSSNLRLVGILLFPRLTAYSVIISTADGLSNVYHALLLTEHVLSVLQPFTARGRNLMTGGCNGTGF